MKKLIFLFFSLFVIVTFYCAAFPEYAQASSRIYVTNNGSNNVSVIDSASNNVIATVPVGQFPRKAVVSPNGSRVYVSNYTDCCSTTPGTVSVINSSTFTVISTIRVGDNPVGMALTPDGSKLYVVDNVQCPSGCNSDVSVIDTATNTVINTIAVPQNAWPAVMSSDGTRLYVSNGQVAVTVIDTVTDSVIHTIHMNAGGIALSPDGSLLYAGTGGCGFGADCSTPPNQILVYDTNTFSTIATINLSAQPIGGEAVNSTGTRLYVTTQNPNQVIVIDTSTNSIITSVSVGSGSNDIALLPDDIFAYVPEVNENSVAVIDTVKNNIVGTISVGYQPWGIGIGKAITSYNLSVPLLKQTANPWQAQEYDTAHLWNPSNPTINAWGCALTSAAMVFKYHGINKLPDGTNLDPGTLNTWLKNQPDGYVKQGWVNWLALSRLSKLAKNINGISFDALEYRRINSADKAQLITDLNNSQPDILQEPGHFIVAKGINGDTFDINDPYYNRSTLNDGYSNNFQNLGRFIPSHTDLSYIMLVADSNVDIKLLDNNNNSIGEEILQDSIVNPVNGTDKNKPIKILYAPTPTSGNYQVQTSSDNSKPYELSAYLYDNNGSVDVLDNFAEGSNQFVLNFDKTNINNSKVTKQVTFTSAISDIKNADTNGLINHGAATSLVLFLQNSQKEFLKNNPSNGLFWLNLAVDYLKISKPRMDSSVYEILYYDLTYLQNLLSL